MPWNFISYVFMSYLYYLISGCDEASYDYKGNDIKTIENINSTTECNAFCKTTEGCKYFTWYTEKFSIAEVAKTCVLKSSNEGRLYSEEGVISGSIACDVGKALLLYPH